MPTLITMVSIFVTLGAVAILNRLAYTIDIRLCRKVNRLIAITQSRRLFALFGTYMRFRFAGEKDHLDELPDQYLVMSNHQSILDIPLYMRFLDGPRLRFVAKAELGRHIPLVSVMLRSGQHCLVDRFGSAGQTMRTLDTFAERVVKNDWIPVIFPEGTRSLDGRLGTFHAAGFRRLIDKAPMPVAVCALDGGWRVASIPGMAKNLRGGGFYRVKILKIYPAPTNKAEQMRILEEGRELIERQLAEWRRGTT